MVVEASRKAHPKKFSVKNEGDTGCSLFQLSSADSSTLQPQGKGTNILYASVLPFPNVECITCLVCMAATILES